MRNPKISVKDLLSKYGRKATRKDADYIAWSVMGKMVDGLTHETQLDIPRLKRAISARNVGELFLMCDALTPQMYTSPAVLLRDRQVVECFKKFSFKNSPFNKREKAKLRFWDAEHMCKAANSRIRNTVFLGGHVELPPDVTFVINEARKGISHVLGTFDVAAMLRHSRFGPGSTLCVTGQHTGAYFKLKCDEPTCGAGAYAYAEALLNYDSKWRAFLTGIHPLDVVGPWNPARAEYQPTLQISDQNKVTFVPKNAKTERSIAIEPYFNLYFQLGVGAMIRSQLRRWSIDLDSQQANQDGALRGSLNGSLATLDFSMASDTLAYECVKLLLPLQWFSHLERLRSRDFLMDGKRHRYHKFSSMGNGFTFELETLIFASLARASCARLGLDPKDVVVYGDDVLIPPAAASLFLEVTSFLGFKINDEKSFLDGPFRESCGRDYFKGTAVRPVYCTELYTVRDVINLSNRLLALVNAMDGGYGGGSWLSGVVDHLRGFIPADVRQHLIGPPSDCMDGYIHEPDISRLACSDLVKWCRFTQTFLHPVVRFQPTKYRRRDAACALYLNHTLSHKNEPFVLDVSDTQKSDIVARDIGRHGLGYTSCDGLLEALVNRF